jgi:dTDP-4-dehydrorhamnose reductase
MKNKVLILGDGILATEIIKQTNWDYISRKKDSLDLENFQSFIPRNNQLKPDYDIIVNCIANTDTYSTDKQSHWNTNYVFVNSLIDFCNVFDIKLVHISTDYLYSGSVDNASEEDVPVHCNNWYGYTKLLSDGLVQLRSNNYLLCRCTHKVAPFQYESAWIDQIGNFDYVEEITKLIVTGIDLNLNGVYNIGTELKNMYLLAKRTKDVSASFAPDYTPKNLSMNIDKFNNAIKNVESPFFSIAIPAYGYEGKGVDFLKHNLEILKKQTFKDFEIVISDHSVDNTISDFLMSWNFDNNLNIKYLKNSIGRGFISPNLNNAMKNCTGKWIKVLFQDDFLFDENSLAIQYEVLKSDKHKWLITTFEHSNDGVTFYRRYSPKYTNDIWRGNNTLGNPSNLTIKNEDLIFFDEELNWLMDCDYYYRLFLKYGSPTIIEPITVVNRTHGNGLTDNTPQSVKNFEFSKLNYKYGNTK